MTYKIASIVPAMITSTQILNPYDSDAGPAGIVAVIDLMNKSRETAEPTNEPGLSKVLITGKCY
jgi:hypothetical protein